MIDNICVLFFNSNKYFNSYNEAYFNSKKPGCDKTIYYVFTPTMQRYKRVCELENAYRKYFQKHFSCTYFDFKNKEMVNQLNLFKEV